MTEPTTITSLQAQIRLVAIARREAQNTCDLRDMALGEWERQNRPLLDKVVITREATKEAEEKLREMTLDVYNQTGSKSPAPGVGVREVVKLDYDPGEALKYAKEHGVALKLDTASFEKMSKIPELKPGFVTIFTEAQATIAQDLKIEEE